MEGGANVLLFVPFGVLAALILPVRRWWLAVACGALTSGAIEIIQFVSLSQRHASLADVVNNTLGALLGAAAVRIIQKPPDRGKAPGTASKPIRKSNEGGVPCEPSQTQQT
ncbi:VanZ family protein [Arthrobacter sp. EPSL27]|uniref:VanZ family protein n=1 Tax=Arthrobacter sp. EPSL27 TaxID=1745378 RepID=UPI003FA4A9A9